MAIDLQNKKIELIQWLSTLDDEFIIDKLMELRDSEKADWWEEITVEEKESIKQGVNDADSGNLKPQSEVRKLYEKWL
ncbi:hypothetical protein [Salegentibacter salegens]|uniref:Addiction module component n=1 Tax=Salegentibacter salegens TaxID=143223 RepID=A0A1M7NCW6_9FLAO|nr:hypothetical protein [Salegentibacter salegens]PRX41565.1 hypothetical protein LY58_02958 [Salegentibacter salegens]SHN01477.1 hypothetical protein SAMN05878281_3039 [Salegentibacter salegens]